MVLNLWKIYKNREDEENECYIFVTRKVAIKETVKINILYEEIDENYVL